jgi:hypothetical protein
MKAVVILVLLLVAGPVYGQIDHRDIETGIAKRSTLAIRYPENDGTSVDMVGTPLQPRVKGKAEVKRKEGRTRVRLDISSLDHPQALGSHFTTYVLWAIAPEGQADSLGEL